MIQVADGPCGVTLTGGHIYWANGTSGTIGVAALDGTAIDESYITGQYQPCGVASYGGYLYWTSGSAQLDGGTVDKVALDSASPTTSAETIVMGIPNPCGVAVDGLFAGTMKLRSVRPEAGGGSIRLAISGPGAVDVQQADQGAKLMRSATFRFGHGGPVRLAVRFTAVGRLLVRGRQHGRVTLTLTFRPRGGIPTVRSVVLRIG